MLRETLWEEINRDRQEVGKNERRLQERTDDYLSRNLSQKTQEAEKKEKRLRGDLKQLRSQQEQTIGTLHTRIASMMERLNML